MAIQIIFRNRDLEEIKKEGYKIMGDPGMLTFKTPIELFTPLTKKLEEAVKDFNSDKIPETNYYAVFEETDFSETKKATDEAYYYKVYALKRIHQKP